VYLRIPAWAGAKTLVSVNGQRGESGVVPGKFLALRRTWKDKDRIELEIEMPLRLEPVDQEDPNIVALVHGPIALFAVGEIPARLTRAQLLAATASSQSREDWIVRTDSGVLTMRPFAAIKDEKYRLYHQVEA
jgi:DUF1680 family protein